MILIVPVSLASNAKLDQTGERQTRTKEITSSILTRGNFLVDCFSCPVCKPLMPALPTFCNYEKTGMAHFMANTLML